MKNRHEYIETELRKEEIDVICKLADGDPKELSAMIQETFPKTTSSHPDSEYFHCDMNSSSCVQDTVHMGNKFKTKLLKDSVVLALGDLVASSAHLLIVINEESKLNHGLTSHNLQKQDKMNFALSQKMCSERVIECLRKIPGTNGIAYLNVMRHTMDSFLQTGITPLQRVLLIWRSLCFLMRWKE